MQIGKMRVECDEYVLPNDEQETGRVSQPGAKSKVITKGMMIAINCDAPDHAFYVAQVLKIRRWSMYYGDKFLKAYQPSFYEDKDGRPQPWCESDQMIIRIGT